MSPTAQARQGQMIAQIALSMPECPTSGDLLQALNAAYRAGVDDTTEKLATGILGGPVPHWLKRQGL